MAFQEEGQVLSAGQQPWLVCAQMHIHPVCMAWGCGPRGAHGAAPHHAHALSLRWALGDWLSALSPSTHMGVAMGQVAPRTLAEISLPSPSLGGTGSALGQGLGASTQQASFLVGL